MIAERYLDVYRKVMAQPAAAISRGKISRCAGSPASPVFRHISAGWNHCGGPDGSRFLEPGLGRDIRLRCRRRLIVSTRDLQRLIARHVRPGQRVLEIGCAPGKMLAWVAAALRGQVSGLDYSRRGLDQALRLFDALHLSADLRCEDLRQTTLPRASFDIVYSLGVIEHFEDPREIVSDHLSLRGRAERR